MMALRLDQKYFNPPSPCGEGRTASSFNALVYDFNPPSPCGEGLFQHAINGLFTNFNPPSPCGEGPLQQAKSIRQAKFQSTLPVWGGTEIVRVAHGVGVISIHPPRVGRDPADQRGQAPHKISIHPPRVGRDPDSAALS